MTLTIRPALRADIPDIFKFIQALAAYENLTDAVAGNEMALERHLFGDRPSCEAIVAQVDGEMAGWSLFFPNYSTFLTQPGIYIEDIYVLPDYRRQGIGQALLRYVAQIALERGAGRLEWNVLEWNQPALEFYQKMGAKVLTEWRVCRVTGEALANLGNETTKE